MGVPVPATNTPARNDDDLKMKEGQSESSIWGGGGAKDEKDQSESVIWKPSVALPVRAPNTTTTRNSDAAPRWSEANAMRLPLIPKIEIECKYLR